MDRALLVEETHSSAGSGGGPDWKLVKSNEVRLRAGLLDAWHGVGQ